MMRSTKRPQRKTFHQFARLPPEIRRRIWYFCLPRRVVEFDLPGAQDMLAPDDPYQETFRRFKQISTRSNRRSPRIMHVDRESHAVASQHGAYDAAPGSTLARWHGPGLDRMFLYHGRTGRDMCQLLRMDPPREETRVRALAAAFAWAREVNMPLALHHLDIHEFIFPGMRLASDPWEIGAYEANQVEFLSELARLGRGDTFACVLVTTVMHVSKRAAAESGLFGCLGEETVQLVDLEDKARVRKYYEFCRTSGRCLPGSAKDIERFWGVLLDQANLQARVDAWQAKTRRFLLYGLWITEAMAARERGEERPGVPEPPFFGRDHGVLFRRGLASEPFESLPWIIAAGETLPVLRPHALFQACHEPSCLWMSDMKRARQEKLWQTRARAKVSQPPPRKMWRKQRRERRHVRRQTQFRRRLYTRREDMLPQGAVWRRQVGEMTSDEPRIVACRSFLEESWEPQGRMSMWYGSSLSDSSC